jgi:hypothetical protein
MGPWDSAQGRHVELEILDAAGSARLAALTREHRATPFMAALAAFGVAARELGDRHEVGILVATHNREEPGLRDSVGWYANMLPLYFPVRAGAPFTDSLLAVRNNLMPLLGSYELPLARVLEDTPAGIYDSVGERFPSCFMSFVDGRSPRDAPPRRWEQLDLSPSHRMSYGIWVVQRESGLRAVVASPRSRSGEARLAEFESRLVATLREAVGVAG